MKKLFAVLCLAAAIPAFAQTCPDKNVLYWQAFPAGGESDLSARHQQHCDASHAYRNAPAAPAVESDRANSMIPIVRIHVSASATSTLTKPKTSV